MVTAANWKIENGALVILVTDGQGWWHPVKVSIVGEHGETCVVRQEARVDEDWSEIQGDERTLSNYGKFFRGISVHDKSPYGWAMPNREEDRTLVDLPCTKTLDRHIEVTEEDKLAWQEWAKNCPNP